MSTPEATLIPTYAGANYAPVKPILEAKDDKTRISNKLADALRERYLHYFNLEKRAWNEILAAGQMVANFTSGKQLAISNPFGSGFLAVQPTRQDESTKRVLNQMQFYRTKIEQMWMTSKPDITVEPGRRTDAAMQAARGAGAVNDFYEKRFYTANFERDEAGLAQTFGTYLNLFHWDMGKQGLSTIREIVENKTLDFAGAGYCGDCGQYDDASKFQGAETTPPQCPKCGSMAVNVMPGQSQQVSSVVGQEKVNLGDLVCHQLPLPGCRWNLYKRPEESSWFIYNQMVDIGALKALVGQIRVPGSNNYDSDAGLEMVRSLAYGGQAVNGRSGTNTSQFADDQRLTTSLNQMWLSPEDLTDIVLDGGEMTVSGEATPKGRLSDLCPEGIVVVGVNQMSLLLGVYQETHKNKLCSGTYHAKTLSGAGRGDVDSVEVQRRLNTLDTNQLLLMQSSATPAYLYRPEAIKGEMMEYLGSPNMNIPLNDLPVGMTLSEVAQQLPPGRIDGAAIQYTQQFLKDQAQMASHCVEFSGAIPGVNNKTAHGAELARNLAQSLFSPMLMVKAYTRQRGAEICVDLYRKHMPVKQPFPLAGKRNGSDSIFIAGCDLDVDLVFDVVDDSWVPKSTLTKREDILAMAQAFGGLEAYFMAKQQDPKAVNEIEQIFGVDVEAEDYDDVTTRCRQRFGQIQAAEKMGATQPEQLMAAMEPPISAIEPLQKEKADWWMGLLDDDDGWQASPLVRATIEAVAALHTQNEANKAAALAMLAGQVQAASQAPMAMGQAQLQQAQAEHGAGLQAQAADQAHGHAIQQQQHAAAVQPQEAPPQQEQEPPPAQKVSEQANYADLPPEAQFEMLTQQMGLTDVTLADVQKVHAATLETQKMQNSQKIAAMKPKPVAKVASTRHSKTTTKKS